MEKAGLLQRELEQAHVTLKERQAELEDYKEHVRRLQEELAVEGQRVQALEEVLSDLRAESREQEKALLALQQQCAEQAQEHEAEARALQDSWLQAEAMLKERDQELEALRAEGLSSQHREEAACGQVEALQEALSKAQADLQEKEQHLLGQVELSRSLEASTATLQAALDSCQAQSRQLEEALRKREGEVQVRDLRYQEAMQQLQQALTQRDEELRQQRKQGQLLEKSLAQRGQEDATQEKQEAKHEREEEEIRSLRESLQELQLTLAQKEEEILELREAQQRKSLEDLSHKGCPGKEPATTFDSLGPRLQRELERLQAALKQTEAREIEWREKAQDLALSLAQSKASVSDLQEVALFLQASVLERDSEQQRLQDELELTKLTLEKERLHSPGPSSRAERGPRGEPGVQLGEVSGVKTEPSPEMEERQLWEQRLEHLQRAVALLEVDRSQLQQHNAQLRTTLEQVERERRKLKRGSMRALRAGDLESGEATAPSPMQQDGRGRQKGCSDAKHMVELQKEVALLRAQLALERKQKQDYIARSVQTSRELADLHHGLSHSLLAVAQAPEATVLEAETRKLDESLTQSLTSPGPALLCPSSSAAQTASR